MLIVLLRHGIAEDPAADVADDDRRLTRKGHRRMKVVARALARLIPNVDAIYSSPLVRAYETAEHVARATTFIRR
jgi:phosphohistidine phosphatase